MAENVEYIDQNKLMAEMQKVRQDLYDGNASPEVVLWWSMAIRIVKLSAAVKAVEKDDARKVEWIPVTPETMPPEDENGESEHLILRTLWDGRPIVYCGFTKTGKWHTLMYPGLTEGVKVTHWMYAKDLAKEVGHG